MELIHPAIGGRTQKVVLGQDTAVGGLALEIGDGWAGPPADSMSSAAMRVHVEGELALDRPEV
jgi:hypothetical protein